MLCVHTLFYFKYSPSQYDLPVQSSLLAYRGLLWRFGIQCHTRPGEGGIIMCTERQQLARHNNRDSSFVFGFVTENKILSFNIIIVTSLPYFGVKLSYPIAYSL